MFDELRPVFNQNDEEVVCRRYLLGNVLKGDQRVLYPLEVSFCNRPLSFVPRIEIPQFDGQYSALYPVHPLVVTDGLVQVFFLGPVRSKHFDKLCYLLFISADGAGFSIRPKIFAWIKTKSANVSD